MKRSFSALFVLITALSGPLVFTPPANSRQNAVASADDASSPEKADDRGESLPSRSEQEHNQPSCLFPLEHGEAPEELIVLPEDFDYEIYSEYEGELCEVEPVVEAPPPDSPPASPIALSDIGPAAPQWQTEFPLDPEAELDAEIENLCLPFAEAIPQWEPWEGPAIAGGEPAEMAAESFELAEMEPALAEWTEIEAAHREAWDCELADAQFLAWEARDQEVQSLLFGRWALNLYEEKAYSLSQGVQTKLAVAEAELKRGLIWLETHRSESMLALFAELQLAGLQAAEGLVSSLENIAQVIENNELANISPPLPTPPYCECWAREALSAPAEADEAPVALDSNIEEVAANQYPDSCPLAAEPVVETAPSNAALEYSEVGQNDAVPPQGVVENIDVAPADSIDFESLQETAEQVWNLAKEKALTLERWTREYELELPNEAPGEADAPAAEEN